MNFKKLSLSISEENCVMGNGNYSDNPVLISHQKNTEVSDLSSSFGYMSISKDKAEATLEGSKSRRNSLFRLVSEKVANNSELLTPVKLKRSQSCPNSNSKVDLLNSESKGSPSVYNQSLQYVKDKFPEKIHRMLSNKEGQSGKVIISNNAGSQRGIGSGILVSKNLFICSKHCILSDMPMFVVFGAHKNYNSMGTSYKVIRIHDPDSEIAQKAGLKCGGNGDFVLLEIDDPEDSLESVGFTSISSPEDQAPDTLYYLGHSSGSHCKVSVSSDRKTLLTLELQRENLNDLKGFDLTWSRDRERGTIEAIREYTNDLGKGVLLEVKKESGRFQHFYIIQDKIYRKNKAKGNFELANKDSNFYVCNPYLFGADHVIVSHRVSGGGSCGQYFTENGELFALNRGAFSKGLFVSNDVRCMHHYAVYPWALNNTTIYDDFLILEGKSGDLSKIYLSENYVNCLICVNRKSLGYISNISYEDECRKATLVNKKGETIGTLYVPYDPDQNITFYDPDQNITFNESSFQRNNVRVCVDDVLHNAKFNTDKSDISHLKVSQETMEQALEEYGYKKDNEKTKQFEYTGNATARHKPKADKFFGNNDFMLCLDRDEHAGPAYKAFYKGNYIGTFNTSFDRIIRGQDTNTRLHQKDGHEKITNFLSIPKGKW